MFGGARAMEVLNSRVQGLGLKTRDVERWA